MKKDLSFDDLRKSLEDHAQKREGLTTLMGMETSSSGRVSKTSTAHALLSSGGEALLSSIAIVL